MSHHRRAPRRAYLAYSASTHTCPQAEPSGTNVSVMSLYRTWTAAMSNPKGNNSGGEQAGDEAAKDPGSLSGRAAVLASADLEGHRVFPGYGFHMPTSAYRRRPNRHRKHHRITNGTGRDKNNKSPKDEDDEEAEMLPKNLRPCMYSALPYCQSNICLPL